MEIIMVYPFDPSKIEGGGGIRYVHNLIINYLDRGIKVKLLGINIVEQQTFKHPLFELVVIQEPHKLRIPSLFQQIFVDIIMISHFLIKLMIASFHIRTSDNSIIHAHRSYFLIPFILFCSNTRKILTLHMKPLEYVRVEHQNILIYINKIYKTIEAFCLRKTDYIIAINDDVGATYIQNYPFIKNKIVTIPTGVNLNSFKPLDKTKVRFQYKLNADNYIIIAAGRLEKIKNIGFLIRSFKIVNQRMPNSKLLIIGKGPEKNGLEDLTNQLGLSDNVIFYGEVLPANMPHILNCGDVLALTSLSEASPNIVKEALACGIPVVSTNVGDVSSIIYNPFLGRISKMDELIFAHNLIEMLIFSSENRNRVIHECEMRAKDFDNNNIISKICDIYVGVLNIDQ